MTIPQGEIEAALHAFGERRAVWERDRGMLHPDFIALDWIKAALEAATAYRREHQPEVTDAMISELKKVIDHEGVRFVPWPGLNVLRRAIEAALREKLGG